MSYSIKEIYYTLQGEGVHTGRPAVFIRFSGCNLWSGCEEDRPGAVCRFCDTDFTGTDGIGGGVYENARDIALTVRNLWPQVASSRPFCVCTGGEPLLQLDHVLLDALHDIDFEVAIETNGTVEPLEGIDWVCVSPKNGAQLVLNKGNELKLVFPQTKVDPVSYSDLEFDYFLLQPMDGPNLKRNTRQAVEYCLKYPQWTLSLQTHKILNIP